LVDGYDVDEALASVDCGQNLLGRVGLAEVGHFFVSSCSRFSAQVK
jgi:hypothetical protein